MKFLLQNIWNQNYFWDKRLPLLHKVLGSKGFTGSDDEIIILLEVKNSIEHNQLEELNNNKYKKSLMFEVKENAGIGVLTNYDISTSKVFKLKNAYTDIDAYDRILVLMKINSLLLAITHLSYDPRNQDANMADINECIEGFNTENLPVIFCGDFNCSPESEAVKYMLKNGFEDSWKELMLDETSTWPIDENLIIQNNILKHGEPPKWKIHKGRIDLFLTKGIDLKNMSLVGKREKGIWHSDHWGIYFEV